MAGNLAERVRTAQGRQAPAPKDDERLGALRGTIDKMRDEFGKVLPSHVTPEMYARVVITCVQKSPKLMECGIESFLGALMDCARLGLMPGTPEAALVPYGKTCTLIPQWQGLVAMMYHSGRVESVIAGIIREADEWYFVPSRRPPDDFHHAPDRIVKAGTETHAYAFAWLAGGNRSRVVLLSEDEGVYIRNRWSQGYLRAEANGKKDSPWHTDFWAMTRKSAVRRLFDWVPTSPEMRWYTTMADDDGNLASSHAPPRHPRPALPPGTPETPAEPEPLAPAEPEAPADRRQLFALFDRYFPGASRTDTLTLVSELAGRPVASSADLTDAEAGDLLDAFALAEATATDDPSKVPGLFRALCADAAMLQSENKNGKGNDGRERD
jgi:recombination protein RecT